MWSIAIFFYDELWMIILMLPIGISYFRYGMEELLKKKNQQFERQFQDALQSLEAQLSVGYSMENAVKEVQKELLLMYQSTDMIVKEFTYMCRKLNLNVTAEEVWKDFADRVNIESVESFVTIFVHSKRSGGDSISIIRNAIHYLRERAGVRQEIETMIAAKKLEFQIMTIVPFGMIAYMRWSFPGFMKVLYQGVAGRIFMSVCLMIYLVAWKMGKKIVEIEV